MFNVAVSFETKYTILILKFQVILKVIEIKFNININIV